MRSLIQSKLQEITNLKSGVIIQEDVIENGTTYFGYTIQENYVNADQDKNRTIRYNIIGYLIRKKTTDENTLQILDNMSDAIVNKLKDLNFKLSVEDIDLSNVIEKKQISGYVYTNEINNRLVI